MFYYDRVNERIYAVDGTKGDGSSSHQFYINTSDRSITEGDLAGSTDEMIDILYDGTRAFATKFVREGAGAGVVAFYGREFNNVFSDSFPTANAFSILLGVSPESSLFRSSMIAISNSPNLSDTSLLIE